MGRYLQRKYRPAQTQKLLGQEVETDDGLEWRVKWGQRGAGVSGLLALICFVAETIYCYYCIWCSFAYISWYIVLQKRLVRDCETIVARNQRGDNSRV